MIALVATPEPRLVLHHAAPTAGAGEALLRTRVAGVCDTDLQITRGYMDHRGVLGHEFVADVQEADSPDWIGRRVVGDINAGCGSCEDCKNSDGHHCSSRTVLGIAGRDGALAEQFVLPVRNLVEVPAWVADDVAVFVEPLAAASHGLDGIPDEGAVAVLGDGKLGLLTVMCLRARGRDTTLFGHHEENLDIARALGAESVHTRKEGLRGLGAFGCAIEATGRAEGLEAALRLVRSKGMVVMKTTVAGRFEIDLAPVVIHELRVTGSRCGSIREAMKLLERGDVDPTPLIRSRFALEQADQAIAAAARPAALKVLVDNKL